MVQPTGQVEAAGSVLPPFPSPDKPAIPEYEEILDLHEAKNRGEEHVLKEGYQITKCPAYAVTSTV